jgi:hypothetical protein
MHRICSVHISHCKSTRSFLTISQGNERKEPLAPISLSRSNVSRFRTVCSQLCRSKSEPRERFLLIRKSLRKEGWLETLKKHFHTHELTCPCNREAHPLLSDRKARFKWVAKASSSLLPEENPAQGGSGGAWARGKVLAGMNLLYCGNYFNF